MNLTGHKVTTVFCAFAILLSMLTLAAIGCGGNDVEVEKRIGPDGGSMTSSDDQALLEVPPGALEQEQVIRSSYTDEFPPVGQISSVYEFGPSKISFTIPARLSISYDPEEIPEGLNEQSLRLAVFSDGWEALPDSTVDTSKQQVSATISGFSEFAVVPQAPPAAEVVRVEDVEARPATTFRMPIGDNGQSDLGNDLDLLTNTSFQTFNYPKIRFNDDGNNSADANEWYVATAFNRDRWLNNGWNKEPSNSNDSYYSSKGHYHPGEDWNLTTGGNTDAGKPLHAIADGVVLYSGWAFGWTIIVAHSVADSGELVASFYGHMQSQSSLNKGDSVALGDILGRVGATGTDPNGAHLHLEIRRQSMLKIQNGNVELAYKAGHWPGTDTDFIADNYHDPSQLIFDSKTCDVAVGQEAPSSSARSAFESAFDRAGGRMALGCATSPVQTAAKSFKNTEGLFQTFANGAIEYHSTGELSGQAFALVNPFFNKWAEAIADDPEEWPKSEEDVFRSLGPVERAMKVLGYPIGDAVDQCEVEGELEPCRSSQGTTLSFQTFEGGALELHLDGPHEGKVYEIHGGIYEKWGSLGFGASDLGLPISDEREVLPSGAPGLSTTGRVSDFEGGHIHWHRDGPLAGQAFEIHGPIDEKYVEIGGTASKCGFPVSDVYAEGEGQRVDFEVGFIRWSLAIGVEENCAVPTPAVTVPTPTPAPIVLEPTPTPRPCPVADASFCDFVYAVDAALASSDVSFIVSRTEFRQHTCGEFPGTTTETIPPEGCLGAPADKVIECVDWIFIGAGGHLTCLTKEKYEELLKTPVPIPPPPDEPVRVFGIGRGFFDSPTGVFLRDTSLPLGDGFFDFGIALHAAQRNGRWVISDGVQGDLLYRIEPEFPWPPQ